MGKLQKDKGHLANAISMLELRYHDHGCEVDNQLHEKQLNPTCGCGLDDIISELRYLRNKVSEEGVCVGSDGVPGCHEWLPYLTIVEKTFDDQGCHEDRGETQTVMQVFCQRCRRVIQVPPAKRDSE